MDGGGVAYLDAVPAPRHGGGGVANGLTLQLHQRAHGDGQVAQTVDDRRRGCQQTVSLASIFTIKQ